jgi:hypothetical protein
MEGNMRFRTKMIICITALLSLTFMIGGSILISVSFRTTLAHEKDNSLKSFQMILYTLNAVNNISIPNFNSEIVDTMQQMDGQSGRSWEAVSLYKGEDNIYRSSALTPIQENDCADTDTEEYTFRLFQDGDTHYLQISGAFIVGQEPTYTLCVLFDISPVYASRTSQTDIYQKVFGAVIVFSFFIAWLMANWLTDPLRRLSQTARRTCP